VENLGGRVGVAGFGILSLVLAVALVTVVNRATGFNPFTLTVWSVIPAGAILTGAAATSGLPLGSRLFRTRPPRLKIVYVVTGAALAVLSLSSPTTVATTPEDEVVAPPA